MTTHRRLQKTMRSPVRQARRDTPHKRNRRSVIAGETWLSVDGAEPGMRVRSVRSLLVLTPRRFLDEVFKGTQR